jgi:hypothetical protein
MTVAFRSEGRYPKDDPIVQAYYRQYAKAISERGVNLTERDRFGYFLDALASFLPSEQVKEIEQELQFVLSNGV